jgi:ferredoxin
VRVRVEGGPDLVVPPGSSLLDVLEGGGLPVEAACGGFACCNTCRVEVLDAAAGLSPRLPEEEPFLDTERQRLACQATVLGDVSVRLAPGA